MQDDAKSMSRGDRQFSKLLDFSGLPGAEGSSSVFVGICRLRSCGTCVRKALRCSPHIRTYVHAGMLYVCLHM